MATWRRRGAGFQSSSQIERELYERARDATNEAQRQGNEQLQAAVAAAAVKPVRGIGVLTQTSPWSLRFGDQRLEKAYQRKSSRDVWSYDAIPTAGQLAFYLFQLWFATRFSQKPQYRETSIAFLNLGYMFNPLYGYFCVISLSTFILLLQLGCLKWYSCNRHLSLQYYVWILWVWETLKLLLITDEILWSRGSLTLVQCVLTSFIYRIPFCVQVYPRIIVFGGQVLAVILRGTVEGMHKVILLVIAGHLVGLLLAYKLDLRARTTFVQSLPRYLLDGLYGSAHGEHSSSYRASFSRQMWSIFYPELFEKSECTGHISSVTSDSPSTPHRALGGFAGGFGGVSGLKCGNVSTAAPLSSSSNPLGLRDLSDSSDDDYSSDTESLEPYITYGLGKSSNLNASYGYSGSSTASACSKANLDWSQSPIHHQVRRCRG